MGINWNFSVYADFKAALNAAAFKGDVFYVNVTGTFQAYAVDYSRNYVFFLQITGSGNQQPGSFSSDFPNAVAWTTPSGTGVAAV